MLRLMVVARVLAAMLVLPLAFTALPAHAQSFDDWVKKLASDDFPEKLEAAGKLGDLGDGRAIPALKALSDGTLYLRKSDGAALIADGPRFFEAASGKGLGELPAGDVDKVRVNNRLRGVISASLSKLSLFSDDRATRLAAAKAAFANPTPETAAALERALKSEKDPEVLAAMRFSLAATQVNAGSVADRVKAIESLAGTADPQVRNLLNAVVNARDNPPEVLKAAQDALSYIERRLAMVGVLENVFQGISLGSVLLLAAVGLAITFGVMGVINMAHGEMIMLGAYTAYTVQLVCRALLPPELVGYYLVFSLPIAFLVSGAVGVVLERGVIRHLYGRPLETMLATWGISLVLQQAVRSMFDAQNKEVANPAWMTGGFDLTGGFFVSWSRLYIIIFCFLMLGIIALVLRRTSFGLHMRAVTQNRDMAAAMGIPTARVDALTFGLGSGLAGMAGVALSQIGNVSPNLGQIYIIDSFLVVVFGGVGNLLGTLVASLSLGIINKILEPFAGAVLGKVAVLVFIILFIQWRPRGLFALKGRFVES